MFGAFSAFMPALIGAGASILGGMLGNEAADERQDDQQNFNQQQQEASQQFNSAEAAATRNWASDQAIITRGYNAEQADKNRAWEEKMSSTAIQRRMQDLQVSGINPMLAYGAGGASSPSGSTASSSTPSGAHASAGMASSGIASPTPYDIPAGMSNAAQASLRIEEAERVKAETEKLKAERNEIEARTPTHAVNIQATIQGMKESEERIRKIIQDTQTSHNSAQNIAQQTENLKAQLPQIEAHIKQLKALTTLNYEQAKAAGASANLSEGQYKEVIQRIHENLPAVEAAYTRARTANTGLETPVLRSRANLHGGEHEGQKLGTVLELGQAISRMIPGIGILIGGKK